jgi:hypothetical protein
MWPLWHLDNPCSQIRGKGGIKILVGKLAGYSQKTNQSLSRALYYLPLYDGIADSSLITP